MADAPANATVIDSIIITLGLDPSKFTVASKEAASSFVKVRDEGVKAAKSIAEANEKAAKAIASVAREALGLFAVFIGGRGIKEFITNITRWQTELSSLSWGLQSTSQAMSAFGMMVERQGGSAARARASFQSLSDQLQQFKHGGKPAMYEAMSKLANLAN